MRSPGPDGEPGHPAALATLLAYHDAWGAAGFDAAMQLVADDVVAQTPAGQLVGAEAFRGFMAPFVASLTRYEQIAAFGDATTAVVVYDTDTSVVAGAPGAEAVTVVDGRIARMRIIFDRLPFDAARRAMPADGVAR